MARHARLHCGERLQYRSIKSATICHGDPLMMANWLNSFSALKDVSKSSNSLWGWIRTRAGFFLLSHASRRRHPRQEGLSGLGHPYASLHACVITCSVDSSDSFLLAAPNSASVNGASMENGEHYISNCLFNH